MTFYTLAPCDTITDALMTKVWKIAPKKSENPIEQFLINRGLTKRGDIERFFDPKLEYFEKEFDIPGIKAAQKRILESIRKGELIICYGDYDVDGVCASAIVYKSLSSLGAKVLPYIPHREKEGYGLSREGLDFAKEKRAKLIITVDHGIVAFDQAKYAKKIGLDLIITDHHAPKDKKPDAVAIVHSIKICGATVAWCLVRNLIEESSSKELLEFVALATVCDQIPLQGVNRALVKKGLEVLNKTNCLGLKALINESGLMKGSIDSYALGHYLGPRLNAIGRLEHAIDALRLLCTKDPTKAMNLARTLTEANNKRRELTIAAIEQAQLQIKKEDKIHVLKSKDWIPGIIGLIAGRITDEYNVPSVAISVGKTHSKGSARSIEGVNIVEVIREVSHLLVDVGGHKGAAGFTIETEKIEEFKITINQLFSKLKIDSEDYLQIESEVEPKKLTKTLSDEIKKFEPFGFGNPQPLLVTKRMKLSDLRTVGDGKHLKLKADGIDCIGFGIGEMKNVLESGQLADLVYFLEINKFNNKETLQLKVKDIKVGI